MNITDWSEHLLEFPITWISREGGCQVQLWNLVMPIRSHVYKHLFTALPGQFRYNPTIIGEV